MKNQIQKLEKKQAQIAILEQFVTTTRRQSLSRESWDFFGVDLTGEPFSFEKLASVLNQTANTDQYIFQPRTLSITLESTAQAQGRQDSGSQSPEDRPKADSGISSRADTIVNLKGQFLVKKRGPDE